MGEVGGVIFQDMINIAQRAKNLWEAEINEAQKKLLHSNRRIEQLEEENAQYRSQAQRLTEELASERKRADVLLKKEATLSDLLKSREQDLNEQKVKIESCEEKLLRTKQLYDSISSQMISLKKSIASSRMRVHNRGDLEDYNSRINQLLASAGNARLNLGYCADDAQIEAEKIATNQTASLASKSSHLINPANKVCVKYSHHFCNHKIAFLQSQSE
jgi:chromosome segregation ATPase